MRTIACVFALCVLFAGADARFQLRNLFQVPDALSTAINAVADGASNATKAVAQAVAPTAAAAAGETAPGTGPAAAPAAGTPAAAASPSPQLVGGRSGVYVLTEPPAMPVATDTAPGAGAAASNVTGPAKPAPGKNLMVVMTMGAADQKDVYKAQQALRAKVAESAGVSPDKVLFFNQSGNVDKRTGQATMSLTLNVDCGNEQTCARAGNSLYNSSTQANLTSTLQTQGVALLPNTTQVFGISGVGAYKGNATLYEGFKIGADKPKTAALPGVDFNNTLDSLGGLELPGLMNSTLPPVSTGIPSGFEGMNATLMPQTGATVLTNGPNTAVVDQNAAFPAGTADQQQLPGAAAGQQAGTTQQPKSAAAGAVVTPLLALMGAAVLLL